LIFYTWIIDWMKWASHAPERDGVAGWLLKAETPGKLDYDAEE
jgi:hypothetical protein